LIEILLLIFLNLAVAVKLPMMFVCCVDAIPNMELPLYCNLNLNHS